MKPIFGTINHKSKDFIEILSNISEISKNNTEINNSIQKALNEIKSINSEYKTIEQNLDELSLMRGYEMISKNNL